MEIKKPPPNKKTPILIEIWGSIILPFSTPLIGIDCKGMTILKIDNILF
jgi:hypothetical protein